LTAVAVLVSESGAYWMKNVAVAESAITATARRIHRNMVEGLQFQTAMINRDDGKMRNQKAAITRPIPRGRKWRIRTSDRRYRS
jgi:hypothetical protein